MIESLTLQLETILGLYREKNPNFSGSVHLIGHGISGLMLFDLLQNQNQNEKKPECVEISPSVPPASKSQNETKPTSLAGLSSKFERKPELTLCSLELLKSLNIESVEPILQQEQIDVSSLMMLEQQDIESLGLPLGPRKKLLQVSSPERFSF